jgi:VWFA-related protein
MMRMRRTIPALAISAALALPAIPQSAPPAKPPAQTQNQPEPAPRIRTTVELVLVPVTVKDAAGETVADLGPKDFRIFEDDVEQKIASFSADPFPLSVVVLLDDDLPTRTAAFVGDSAGALTGGLGPRDEAAVMLFEQFPRTVIEFTSDSDALHDRLKRLDLQHHAPGQGSVAMTSPPRLNTAPIETGVPQRSKVAATSSKNLDDAVLAAGELLRDRGRDRRKIILVVSDGHNSHRNMAKYEDALRVLLSADISVYAIGVSEAVLNRIASPLGRYASATGGDTFYAPTRSDIENLYGRVCEQARNQFTLSYSPRGTDRSLEYHSIEVRVLRPRLKLLIRDGYFTLAPK